MKLIARIFFIVIPSTVLLLSSSEAFIAENIPYQVTWSEQIGTSAIDSVSGIAIDLFDHVYLSGRTGGVLGDSNLGLTDAFITKYSANGNRLWTEQFGTSKHEGSPHIFVTYNEEVFTTGDTSGIFGLPGQASKDVFLAKHNSLKELQWIQQFGVGQGGFISNTGVAADSVGNLYLSGYTESAPDGPNLGGQDAFLSKFNVNGAPQWTRQFGTQAHDAANSIAISDADDVYVAGATVGDLAATNFGIGGDPFVSKYNAAGDLQWTKQLQSNADDGANDIDVDSAGNVYITGYTRSSLGADNAGDQDIFVTKFDAEGTHLWTGQIGSPHKDEGVAIVVDSQGNSFVAANTYDSVGGAPAGDLDFSLSKFDASGKLDWTKHFGTTSYDQVFDLAIDHRENLYLAGYTSGDLVAPNQGLSDAFLIRLSPIPEPSGIAISLILSILLSILTPSYARNV